MKARRVATVRSKAPDPGSGGTAPCCCTIPETADQIRNRKKLGSGGGRPPSFDKEDCKKLHAVECGINRLKRYAR
ncbi:hypothetical protein AB0K43_13055 [Kitasatospora sp. NPDC049258]|uniref:hypothetical protein n=1 Tax=Kitasatospora sp. NPDC049258 TaxID=3155394 RepID=UPI00341BE31B